MYYWSILRKSNEELVKQFFDVQKDFASKNDWVLQVENDLKTLNIEKTEKEIQKMTKYSFKKLIKNNLNRIAKDSLLNDQIEERKSKIKNLNSYKIQNYLQTSKLSTKQKKLLFGLRTRSIDVKTNYKNKFKFNMKCRICDDDESIDSEKHYLKCSKVIEHFDANNEDISNATYDDIFSEEIEKQISITKTFELVFKIRFKLTNIKY